MPGDEIFRVATAPAPITTSLQMRTPIMVALDPIETRLPMLVLRPNTRRPPAVHLRTNRRGAPTSGSDGLRKSLPEPLDVGATNERRRADRVDDRRVDLGRGRYCRCRSANGTFVISE